LARIKTANEIVQIVYLKEQELLAQRAYVLALWFFFFWCLIFEVTERISTNLGHIYFFLNLVLSPLGIYPYRLGFKNVFWNRLWPNISLQRNMIPTIPRFGELWSTNGWRVFAQPPTFSHWETVPALLHGRYITDSRQTLAHFCCVTILQSRTTECQSGSCWAMPCI